MARWFGRLYPLFGLEVEHRFPQNKEDMPRCIYIGNHQNNFDMVTLSLIHISLYSTVTDFAKLRG